MQGGKEKIEAEGIQSFSLVQIDSTLFSKTLEMGIINENQEKLLNNFFMNPDTSMKQFLIDHPEFLKNALHADEKTKKRAQLLIDGNLYGLK